MNIYKTIGYVVSLCVLIACNPSTEKVETAEELPIDVYRLKSMEAKTYCQKNQLNTDFFILIDLKRHSGLKRFYVWDFKQNEISESYLVSHGCGSNPWKQDQSKDNAQISNENDSHCSSIGKYIIGERGISNWGIKVKYLLHGQEITNNKAIKRAIVLHSWEAITDEEVFPNGTLEGWGCPAISNKAMTEMDKRIKKSSKKVLMWII